MSNEEPEYLKALRRARERQKGESSKATAQESRRGIPTPAEREAIRWAHEVGGKEITIAPSLSGARCAILLHPITPFGKPRPTLEGLPNREALADRIQQAIGAGENVMGCYELTTGRPLTAETAEGKVTFVPGKPRAIPKAETPEKMIRRATAQAELMAKNRKTDDRRGGGGSPGGKGGGRGR